MRTRRWWRLGCRVGVLAMLAYAAISVGRAEATVSFATRCAAAGVFICEGFNTPGNNGFNALGSGCVTATECHTNQGALNNGNGFIYTLAGGTNWPVVSNDRMTEGTGSLRLAFPNGAIMDQQMAQYVHPFNRAFAPGANNEWWLQFKQYYPAQMNTGSSFNPANNQGWKVVDMHNYPRACDNIEITQQNTYLSAMLEWYTQCGPGIGPFHSGDTVISPYYVQGGTGVTFACDQSQVPGPCLLYPSNVWMVQMIHIKLGAWGASTSLVEAWAAIDGQPLQKYLYVPDWPFFNSSDSASAQAYTHLQLTNYMTGGPTIVVPTFYTYYDELIMSTQAIADPASAGGTPPAAPTNLRVN